MRLHPENDQLPDAPDAESVGYIVLSSPPVVPDPSSLYPGANRLSSGPFLPPCNHLLRLAALIRRFAIIGEAITEAYTEPSMNALTYEDVPLTDDDHYSCLICLEALMPLLADIHDELVSYKEAIHFDDVETDDPLCQEA